MKKWRPNVSSLIFAGLLFLTRTAGAETLFWIEPCTRTETACAPADGELARWALQAWQKASGGRLKFTETDNRTKAQIRVLWGARLGGLYGEMRAINVDGRRGAELYIRYAIPADADALLRDTIVYLTCLHEAGHALGLPHTARFEDIMYSFQHGGDIAEYFGRYRRVLSRREDIRRNAAISENDRAALLAGIRSQQ